MTQEEVGIRLEGGRGAGPDEDTTERLVAGGDTLCEGGEIRRDPVVMGREPSAEATEPGDHLIEDEVGAVLVAQLAQALQVPILCGVDAAGTLDRLGDDRGHLVAPVRHQGRQRLDVVGRHLHDLVDERPEVLAVGSDALRARTAVGGAVIAADARDDQLAVPLACLHVRDAGQLHDRVDRLAAGAGEEHAGAGDRADLAELLGDLLGRVGSERIEAGVGLERGDLM